jgi:hypothetical protein
MKTKIFFGDYASDMEVKLNEWLEKIEVGKINIIEIKNLVTKSQGGIYLMVLYSENNGENFVRVKG